MHARSLCGVVLLGTCALCFGVREVRGGEKGAAAATRKSKSPEELLTDLEAAYRNYAKIPHSVHTKAFHEAVAKSFVHPDKRVASAGLEMIKKCGCYRCRWLLKDVLHDSEATVGLPKVPSWEVLRSAEMVLLAMELDGRYVRGKGGRVAYHRRSAEDKVWFLCATYWQHRTTGRIMRWAVRKLSSVPHELAGEILEDIEKDVDRQVRKVGGGWLTIELQPAIKRSKRLQKMVMKAKNKFALLALEEAIKDDDPDKDPDKDSRIATPNRRPDRCPDPCRSLATYQRQRSRQRFWSSGAPRQQFAPPGVSCTRQNQPLD